MRPFLIEWGMENRMCRMILFETTKKRGLWKRGVLLMTGALALAACGTVAPPDDSAGSRLTQPAGVGPQVATDAGDIAIAGQYAAHAIRDLPQVADAPRPLMVQFTGVTSIINGPVDTEPYTALLRDRLVVLCHEKLRFVERELPPLIVPKPKKIKSKKQLPPPVEVNSDPDYQVLAELRGNFADDFYKIQIQFVDFHTGEVLFNGLYRIRKEAPSQPADQSAIPETDQSTPAPPAVSQSPETGVSPPPASHLPP